MDATCNVQDSIHVFHLVHNMCPGFWVHIIHAGGIFLCTKSLENHSRLFCLFKTNGFVPPLLYKLENTSLLSFRDFNTISVKTICE